MTDTAISAARLYWENKFSFFDAKGVSIPAAVSVFPGELYRTPRSWAERAYPNLIHDNQLDRGGHFAAWEQPQIFSEEVRAGFRSRASSGAENVPAGHPEVSWAGSRHRNHRGGHGPERG